MKRFHQIGCLAVASFLLSTSLGTSQALGAASNNQITPSGETLISSQTKIEARRRKRRCRWVPGHGLVCDYNWFGF